MTHLLAAEAVLAGLRETRRVLEEQQEKDRAAWAEAHAQLEAARGGR